MTLPDSTKKGEKTRYGKISDYEAAQHEMSASSIGELTKDVAEYEETPYEAAQEIARSFHNEQPEKYNKNQLIIREAAKEKVDKYQQPEWAWDILSVKSEDLGKSLLEVPSDGQHKGLLLEEKDSESSRKCYLYSKDANGISATQHIERFHLNISNATSIGYDFPSEEVERVALDIGEERVPMLQMDFNEEMVPTDQLTEYFEGKTEKPSEWREEIAGLMEEELLNSSYSDQWFENVQDAYFPEEAEKLYDLGDLITNGMFFCKGPQEFDSSIVGNMGIEFPENWESNYDEPEKLFENSSIVLIDSGEYIEKIENFFQDEKRKMLQEDPILTEEQKRSIKD